jgi:hypothetical protein
MESGSASIAEHLVKKYPDPSRWGGESFDTKSPKKLLHMIEDIIIDQSR